MGRKLQGATPRDNIVAVRLNDEELRELETKRTRRSLDTSSYFRTLLREDKP